MGKLFAAHSFGALFLEKARCKFLLRIPTKPAFVAVKSWTYRQATLLFAKQGVVKKAEKGETEKL